MRGSKIVKNIPEKWELKTFGDVLSIGSGKDYKHLNAGDIPVYGTGGLMTFVDQYLFDGESVGIGRKGTIDKPVLLKGKFWTVDTLFYTHSFKGVIPYFIFTVFQSIDWRRYNEATGVPSLSKVIIEKIPLLVPPLPEQQKIAEILSTVDEKIDIIDQQIAETEELKKGLMQRLLTKGIGHTEFKDSPLGKIPKSWEVKKLGEVCDVRDGTHDSPKYHKEGVPFITSKNLTDTKLSFDDVKFISEEDHASFSKRSHVENGDILFGMIGTVGKPVIVNEDFSFSIKNVALLKFADSRSLNNVFALNVLKSVIVDEQFKKVSNGGVLNFVALGNIRNLLFPVPPLTEQLKMSKLFNAADDKVGVLNAKKTSYQELKKGLMQKLLTGKVRVNVE